MTPSKRLTATKALLSLALACLGMQTCAAQVAGTVMQLSGPLMVKKPDGKIRILALQSGVESGDTLVTEKNTYALVKFIDNSEITLRPSTTFVIEQFSFEAGQPEADRASFSLVHGGLRSQSGLLGKRNRERFALKTPVATIGIHGTYFTAEYVPTLSPTPVSPGAQAGFPTLAPGLYVNVINGQIGVNNNGGSLNLTSGQFGYTQTFTSPPLTLPANPGIPFSAPPSFTSFQASPVVGATANQGAVDCVVR
jgi:hypothetical protein